MNKLTQQDNWDLDQFREAAMVNLMQEILENKIISFVIMSIVSIA